MSETKQGIKTILEDGEITQDMVDNACEQLDLMGDDDFWGVMPLTASAAEKRRMGEAEEKISTAKKRGGKMPGAGRPPGAKNKRTKQMADYILKRYGASPLDSIANIAFRPLNELVHELKMIAREEGIELGADLMEVLKIQIACLKELAPYVHSKMPTAVDVNAKSAGVLLIGDLSAKAQDAKAFGEFGLDLGEPLENKGLTTIDIEKSDSGKSDHDI